MVQKVTKFISFLFYILFFFVPLTLYTKTSELFEFNKIVLVYGLTTLITGLWIIRMVVERRFIFKRSYLDIPLLLFLIFQSVSTVISLDPRMSLLGYYSRFNGGLISTISYALLYWAFVSNMTRKTTFVSIYALLSSGTLVALYGILQHFGIDKHLWIQDVQTRVFSTLGQPNWLAAWIVAITPLTWSFALISNIKNQILKVHIKNIKFLFWWILSAVFFITLLFTKSRSGILAFGFSSLIYWSLMYYNNLKTKIFNFYFVFLLFNISFFILFLFISTPWRPNIFPSPSSQPTTNNQPPTTDPGGPVPRNLGEGGTESGEIRKIVWEGAIDIWRAHPLIGTGVETFGISYYQFKPLKHNLTSEWDFLYNKAHNEYLNYAANSGSLGFISYLILIIVSIIQIIQKSKIKNQNDKKETKNLKLLNFNFEICTLNFALLTGYASILVTNFFGFSVVPTSLLFFLFPALAEGLEQESERVKVNRLEKLKSIQILATSLILSFTLLLFYSIYQYWSADFHYSKAQKLESSDLPEAQKAISRALTLSPNESLFWIESSDIAASFAQEALAAKDSTKTIEYVQKTVTDAQKAIEISPNSVNIYRRLSASLLVFATYDQEYLSPALIVLEKAVELAPHEPKIMYNLALAYAKSDDFTKAKEIFQKTIILKPDYRNARFGLALIYINEKNIVGAKEELRYILEHIDPNDTLAKSQLEELNQ